MGESVAPRRGDFIVSGAVELLCGILFEAAPECERKPPRRRDLAAQQFGGGLAASYVVNTQVLKLQNTIWALILPLTVSSFNVTIARTFFRTTVPDSIIESARIDGASQPTIFFRIVLPISKPVLATIGLFLAFGYWNDWYQSMLYIKSESLQSLQAMLNSMQKDLEFLTKNPTAGLTQSDMIRQMPQESVRMAIAFVVAVPIACVYPFFQKYFISGLTIGAVKG